EAYFYYDALALLALATEAAAHEAGGTPSRDQVKAQVTNVAGPPGESVGWDELDKGLKLVRAGKDIDYRGASGSVDLNGVGDSPGEPEFWSIEGGQIIAK